MEFIVIFFFFLLVFYWWIDFLFVNKSLIKNTFENQFNETSKGVEEIKK